MNGNNAILDSNILIYLSKNELPLAFLDQFDALFISVISYMEVLGYAFRNSEEENFVKEIIDLFDVRFINQEIAEIVIKYRKRYRIKLPDAIIAATAEAYGFCLVTRNIDIKMLNPFD